MKYDVELVSCSGNPILVEKKLQEICGCDLITARRYVRRCPCIISSDVDESDAKQICDIFQSIGANVKLIGKEEEIIPSVSVPEFSASSNLKYDNVSNNDRDMLVKLWYDYTERNKAINRADTQVEARKREIDNLQNAVNRMQKEIDDNRMIARTNGESLRPKVRRRSLFEFPDFDTLKWAFIIMAVVYFVVMLVLVAITPKTVENLADAINFNAGALVWVGAPAVGLVGAIVFSLIYIIKNAIENYSINRARENERRNFDTASVKNKAIAFLNNLDSYLAEINKKENDITSLKAQINAIETEKHKLPAVENNIPMPNELRSSNGMALLIQYIDTGRARTLQEAINLYYQDLKDSQRMAELRKQTEYAEEQLMNSRIVAENSQRTLEEAKRQADNAAIAARNAARAADAAESHRDYEIIRDLINGK